MKTLKIIQFVLYLFIILLTVSCNENNNDKPKAIINDTLISEEKLNELFFSLPGPFEIIRYIDSNNVSYHPALLNSVNKQDQYSSNEAIKLNIGIYSADAAYQAFFRKSENLPAYMNAINTLCNEKNIQSNYAENYKQRLSNNQHNSDSLGYIATEMYVEMINNLLESEQNDTYIMISSGAMIETLYLLLNSPSGDLGNKIESKIIEQKLLIEDLFKMAEELKNKDGFDWLIKDIRLIHKAFENIGIESKNVDLKKQKSGNYLLTGNINLTYSSENYIFLKKTITNVRNKWVK